MNTISPTLVFVVAAITVFYFFRRSAKKTIDRAIRETTYESFQNQVRQNYSYILLSYLKLQYLEDSHITFLLHIRTFDKEGKVSGEGYTVKLSPLKTHNGVILNSYNLEERYDHHVKNRTLFNTEENGKEGY